jgi:hypothetical protein
MDRSRASLLALPQQPAGGPRLRKKLQKVAKPRSQPPKPPPHASLPSLPSLPLTPPNRRPGESRHSGGINKLGTKLEVKPVALPRSPDLSDAKWHGYVRRSGYGPPNSSAQSTGPPSIPRTIIPEFSHLALIDPSKWTPPDTPTSSTSNIMRRRAKTPVFSIGQLESLTRTGDLPTPEKTPTVEVIAEGYRALLESRMSMLTDSHSEPALPNDVDLDVPIGVRRNSLGEVDADRASSTIRDGAPTSDDGTLVAFDDETVYFKPVSFSPEPASPAQHYEFSPMRSPAVVPDNLSLQICLDLLIRELSSSMAQRPQRNGTDVASLQIWVMIEAYERLRDQLLDARLCQEELRPLELMFDMWLRALYTIHDSLTGGSGTSDTDYETLELEALETLD